MTYEIVFSIQIVLGLTLAAGHKAQKSFRIVTLIVTMT